MSVCMGFCGRKPVAGRGLCRKCAPLADWRAICGTCGRLSRGTGRECSACNRARLRAQDDDRRHGADVLCEQLGIDKAQFIFLVLDIREIQKKQARCDISEKAHGISGIDRREIVNAKRIDYAKRTKGDC